MEPVGLSIGIAGLAGVFTAAVDCFEYVRIAKTFDQDFATSQLKLDGAGFRLSRWGEAIKLIDQTTASLPNDRYKRAEKILNHLCNLFVQAQEKADIFGDPSAATYDPTADMSPAQLFVHSGILTKTRKRVERHRPSIVQKTKWALYKKKELNSLIDDIVAMVGQLEMILPPGQDPGQTLQRVADLDVAELSQAAQAPENAGGFTSLDVAETLQDVAAGQDPYLEDAIKKLIETLRPEKENANTSYSVSQKVEGGVHNNRGIFAAFNTGGQTYYEGVGKGPGGAT